MKKLESTLLNMVLVLTGVAVIMGGILAYVNHLTEGPIAEQKAKALADGIKSVMCVNDIKVAKTDTVRQNDAKGKELIYIIYQTQDAQGKDLGAAVESTTGGFGGDLKVLVGFDPEGKILGYTLLEHAETPGLGAKADKWFQKGEKGDIIGKSPAEPLTVSKDGGKVDAITASTITSRAFLLAVNNAYSAYKATPADAETGATSQVKSESFMNAIQIIKNGIVKENPTFVLMLGMCPTLATTTSAMNGMSMGLATMAVLICTNVVISCLKSVTPDKVRIPVFIVVIAAFVTILQLVIKAFLPDIDAALGLFIPLIVVNCIILGRAEAFAAKQSPVASLFDGIGIGLGFTLGLTLLGICRELLGSGSIFGLTLLPETYNILLFVLPPGAFITLGFLIAIVNKLRNA